MDILTKKVTSKKVRGNNVDFSTIEITSRKVDANDMDFSTSKITPMKGRGNQMNFLAIEIASDRCRIDVDLKWCARWVKVKQIFDLNSFSRSFCGARGTFLNMNMF